MIASVLEVWRFRPLIGELVRRDLKLRYKNSIGGVAWSLLNPLMQIAVITLLMRFILANPVKNYSAYLFALFLWNFFNVSLSDGCASIISNSQLVRKVYFPRSILPLATLLSNLFHFGIAFIFTVVYFFILGAYPANLRIDILWVIPIIFFVSLLCLGFSLFLSYLNVFYEDVRFILNALLQLFFYSVPILYPIERVAAQTGIYKFYMLNPMAAFLVSYQRALLAPPIVAPAGKALPVAPLGVPYLFLFFACVVSVAVLIGGYVLFEKNQWEMVERL